MYRIGIVDDEKYIREQIEGFIGKYAAETGLEENRDYTVRSYKSANLLLRNYRSDLDILFLDIAMNGLNGMAAARKIREADEQLCIIFVTSMQQYAVEGYSVHAFGFVVKPVRYAAFRHIFEAALQNADARQIQEQSITLRNGLQIDRIPVSDVLYCEVSNHSCEIHTTKENRNYRISIRELEQKFAGFGFFRPHTSYLVHYTAIRSINSSDLELVNGERIPISQHRRREFLAALTDYLEKNSL